MMKIIKPLATILLLLLATQVLATDHSINTQIEYGKKHLVFIDIWSIYEDKTLLNDLEKSSNDYQQILVQPEMNVTQAQLNEFTSAYSIEQPVILDKEFTLTKQYGRWQMPFHTLLSNGKVVFQGDHAQYLAFQNQTSISAGKVSQPKTKSKKELASTKRTVGSPGYIFSETTFENKRFSLKEKLASLDNEDEVNIVFLDSLCPMPHFPDCESKLSKLRKEIEHSKNQQWVGVVSSFYVDRAFAKDFLSRQKLNFESVFDTNNTIFRRYGVFASPYVITLNKQGIITLRGGVDL